MERIKQAVEKARENRELFSVNEKRAVDGLPKCGVLSGDNALRSQNTEEEYIPNTVALGADAHQDTFQRPLHQITYTHTKIIPVNEKSLTKNRIMSNRRSSKPVGNAYKMLRTRLLQQMKQKQWSTIGVTSPGAGEGKTLTAINLAISLAAEGNHTVMLADFDLQCPSVAATFAYDPEYDIGDYLFNNVCLSEVLFNPGIDRLVVLPANKPIVGSSEVLFSREISMMVEEIKSRYLSRIIIFDLPPLLAADDVLALSPLLDAALLVVEDGKTRKNDLMRAMDMLQSVELAGVVLNKTSEKQEF